MSSLIIIGDMEYSDGPDPNKGGYQCTQHHEGIRTGIKDYCCCCDPCKYIRPPLSIQVASCCRCVPKMLCIVFTPDNVANSCCKSNSLSVTAEFSSTPLTPDGPADYRVNYTGTINGIDFTLFIAHETTAYGEDECYWGFETSNGYVAEKIYIDHVNISCLSIPDVVITGVVDSSGCTGSVTFGNSDLVKVPYQRALSKEPMKFFTPIDPQCDCVEVPQFLCVDGIRHSGEAREQVQFEWNQDLGDRWSYLPCGGNVTNDQEHIYLRGDHYGNCYLEFDFEQSGIWTNDWGIPPNTLGEDIHEIREGMVAINSCGCDLAAYDLRPEFTPQLMGDPPPRFVYVSAGDCSCWKYRCGSCRCVVRKVCISGEIDGQLLRGVGEWNGFEWVFTGGDFNEFTSSLSIELTSGECGDCVLRAKGTFTVPFEDSIPVDCGEGLAGELHTEFSADFPETYNWLWVSAAPCDCKITPCFLCAEERCGGMPELLYYEIETRPYHLEPYVTPEYCNITVELHYFKRFFANRPNNPIICGYIGHTIVSCPPDEHNAEARNFIIRVSVMSGGPGAFNYQVDRAELNGTPISFSPVFIGVRPLATIQTCDPFFADSGWNIMTTHCRWGCANIPSSLQPSEMRETFLE